MGIGLRFLYESSVKLTFSNQNPFSFFALFRRVTKSCDASFRSSRGVASGTRPTMHDLKLQSECATYGFAHSRFPRVAAARPPRFASMIILTQGFHQPFRHPAAKPTSRPGHTARAPRPCGGATIARTPRPGLHPAPDAAMSLRTRRSTLPIPAPSRFTYAAPNVYRR